MSGPRVVLGMPVYNSERFLPATLQSVAAQDWPNLDVVISDDASADGTASLCEAFARRHSRVRFLRHPRRLGWVANYNSLLEHATGDYFLWVPHDDLYEPTYVRELVLLLERRPDAVLGYSGTVSIDADGHVTGGWAAAGGPREGGVRLVRALRYLWWPEREKFIPFRGLVRSGAIRCAGGLEAGDWGVFADDLWLFRLSLIGGFAYEPRPLCLKRVYEGSAAAREPATFRRWNAYLGEYGRIVRRASLPWPERIVLLAAIRLRQVWLAGDWGLRRLAWRLRAVWKG